MIDAGLRLEGVNDVHSALNGARQYVARPRRAEEVAGAIARARSLGLPVSICGGRHAMGGQQFADGGVLLDMRGMDRIVSFDAARGLVTAEGGIQWPALIRGLIDRQRGGGGPTWAVAQKQTGADTLTLGGSVSANVHGRGLLMAPIVEDVESLTLVDAAGIERTCSRECNAELFSLVVGGYGLFGVVTGVTLRLTRRRTLRRLVAVVDIADAVAAAEERIAGGALYGDFQFDIDGASPGFLTRGVFSCYQPVEGDPEPPEGQRELRREDWMRLLVLAHTDKSEAFRTYAAHYLATDGQLYKTDTHQLGEYLDGYHAEVDRLTGAACRGSEMITELYVPPERLIEFLRAAAGLLVERSAQVIYGTVRLIQPESTTVLAWATRRYACTVLNLHVDHTAGGIAQAGATFRGLIDLALGMGGSYFLTYHRFATAAQLGRAYPRAGEFFAAKRRLDPGGVFRSDWYAQYAPAFAAGGA